MKTKMHVRFLALFLSLLLLILAVPLSGFAKSLPVAGEVTAPQETDDVESVEMLPDEPGSEAKIDPYGIGEVVSLREETVKHFDMGDGTYQAFAYGVAVHRKDASGEWADIDNTLTLAERGDAERFVSSDERIAFAPSLDDGTIWTLSENGYSVSLSLTGEGVRGTAAASVQNHATREEQIAAAKTSEDPAALYRIDNRTTVLYENVFPGVDIEYILSGNDVKENIVIRQAGGTPTYSFVFAVEGLTADYDEGGAVLLSDAKTGEAIYRIPAPYMTDAAGVYSDAVAYTFRDLGDGRFELTVSASEEWINDPERVFPVKVDPTLETQLSSIQDTYVNSTNSTTKGTVYGSQTWMVVGSAQTGLVQSSAMPTLPTGAYVILAKLILHYSYNRSDVVHIAAHRFDQSWSESTATWNILSNYGQDPTLGISGNGLAGFNPGNSNYSQEVSLDITSAALYWYAGTSSATNGNNGIALKMDSGNYLVYFSTKNTQNGLGPVFAVSYRLVNGVYSIYNSKSGGNYYMQCNNPDEPATAVQEILSSAPNSAALRRDLFKITYRSSSNDFVIRSMLNNELILYADASSGTPKFVRVTVNGAPATDADVPTTHTWKMTPMGIDGEYIWHRDNNSSPTYYLRSASGTDGDILSLTTSSADSGTKWLFSKFTGTMLRGFTWINYPSVMVTDETRTIKVGMYDERIGVNGPVTYSVTDLEWDPTNVASINQTTGVCTAHQTGDFQVCVNYSGSYLSDYKTITVEQSYVGDYYIRNRQRSVPYVQLEHGASASTLNGEKMFLKDFDGFDYQRWIFTYLGNGYYKIVTMMSGNTEYVITVPTGSEGSTDVDLTLKPYTGLSNQKWRIIPTTNGAVKIKAKSSIGAGLDLVMDLEINQNKPTGDGLFVRQMEYINNTSYNDEWFLEEIDESNRIIFCGIPYSGLNPENSLKTAQNALRNVGYNNSCVYSGTMSPSDCNNHLKDCQFFTIVTHGQAIKPYSQTVATVIGLNGLENYSMVGLYSHYTSSMSAGSQFILSTDTYEDLYVALFIGSHTACDDGSGNDLPTIFFAKGAIAAVGFDSDIDDSKIDTWMNELFSYLSQGYSINYSISKARLQVTANSGLQYPVVCGEGDYIPFLNISN